MKFNKQIIMLLALAGSLDAFSYDFSKGGIYYDVVSEENLTVEVSSNGNNTYRGNLSIKGTVDYDNKSYTVVGIGKSAFSGSENLTSVKLPSTVTYIADRGFFRCKSLAEVEIPQYVTSLGESAFDGCTSLASLTLPEGVASAGLRAFADCTALKSAILPQSLKSVPNSMFYGCTALESVVIPEGVGSIGNQTFQGCKSLTQVVFPSSVASIGESAFSGCVALRAVSLPEGLKTVSPNLFYQCSGLEDVSIPSTVTELGQQAFTGCTSLKSIAIPQGVTEIPGLMFSSCESLAEVTLGDVETIGEMAFYECKSLDEIALPETLKTIGVLAFSKTSIKALTLPSSLEKIDARAFEDCNNIASIVVEPSTEALVFGWTDSYAGGEVRFDRCPLVSIVLGRDISYREGSTPTSYSPFRGPCDTLKDVVVGDDVTDAALLCLNDKWHLERVVFGSGLASVPAMNKCDDLKTIELKSSMPQEASEFTDAQYASVMLYVPAGSRQAYVEAPVWGKFAHIVEKDMSLAPSLDADGVSVDSANGSLRVSGADGQPVAVYSATTGQNFYMTGAYDGASISLAPGVYIVKVADKVIKVTL